MGTEVVVGAAEPAELSAIQVLFERREEVFSRFRETSELSAVNRSDSTTLVVSELFASTVQTALRAASETGSLVDPTLGAAIAAAGYDRDHGVLVPDRRPAGPAGPGCRQTLRLSGCLLTRPAGVALDLNGVVKSLAVDAALALIGADGFVAAGGDIATRGEALVALPAGGSIRLLAGGMATSGTTRRRWLRGDGPQHHLIDPRTGRPSGSRWTEVTVAAGSCLAADVAAKAAFLLDEQGPVWLDERGLPGRFVAGCEIVCNDSWHQAGLTERERGEAGRCS
jgi:thiamine biosynthesis lipoprotein